MIRVKEVRVIGPDGSQLGILPIKEAFAIAEKEGLDLVEVSPQGNPPVCKIMDYGKYRYRQSKKLQQAKKKQKHIQVKEVKMTPKTEEHDYQFKLRHVKRFLSSGDKVKVVVMFKGREMAHPHLGRKVLDRIIEELNNMIELEQKPKLEGYNMTMILIPKH
jgi:translation initiation factor IF-3